MSATVAEIQGHRSHDEAACAIRELTAEIRTFRVELFYLLHAGLATKTDLHAMEKRLTELISLSASDKEKLADILRISEVNKGKLENIAT